MKSGVLYTDEFLARAKLLVETDARPMVALAADLGIPRESLYQLIYRRGWRSLERRHSGQKVPDDLPYWRFRIYRKTIKVGGHAEALRVALAAPLPKYMQRAA